MLDSESYTRASALTSTLMFRHRRKKQASVHINALYITLDKRACCAIHRASQCKVRDIADIAHIPGRFVPNVARTPCEIYVCKAVRRADPLMGLCKCCTCHLDVNMNVNGSDRPRSSDVRTWKARGSLRRLAVTLDLVRAPCLGKSNVKYCAAKRRESLPRGLASSQCAAHCRVWPPHTCHTAFRDLYQVCISCNNDDAPEFRPIFHTSFCTALMIRYLEVQTWIASVGPIWLQNLRNVRTHIYKERTCPKHSRRHVPRTDNLQLRTYV